MNIFLSKIGHDFSKGPFKYYVIKEVGGLGQKMAIGWVGLKSQKHDEVILEWSLTNWFKN
jgi:hypothetical protein